MKDELSFDVVPVQPIASVSVAPVAGARRGRSFRQTVWRHWLGGLCMKGRDDEKEKFFSSLSKLNPIPLESKERDRSDEKDISPIRLDPIPLDLEVEILSRLPAKSLMKFICVSKMWSSIIRSQRFVDSYNAMSSTRSRFLITLSNGPFAMNHDMRLFFFSSSQEGKESSSLATNLDMTIPSVSLCYGCMCVSVHGLIGGTWSGPFIVCNPSTGKVTKLPCSGQHTACFGYDPVEEQFKVLTMLSFIYRKPEFLEHEVITLGGRDQSSLRRNKVTTPLYYPVTKRLCINGFVYFGAWSPRHRIDPVIVCFDVRFETISFIRAPMAVVHWECESILIEYKGKLASIARHPYSPLCRFDLWILEDVKKQDWSKQTFLLPFSLGLGKTMTSPGTNKAGEIIFSPIFLSRHVEPFYIFYYNVERKDMRRVRLLGIADTEEFRRRYRLVDESCVYISPQHVESLASL